MNFWKKLFARNLQSKLPPNKFSQGWDSLMSFSIVIPFTQDHLQNLSDSLREAAKFRSELANICHRDYYPDPLYEKLIAMTTRSEELSQEEQKYIDGTKRYYDKLAADKIGIALVYEEPRETLSVAQSAELGEISKPYPSCRVLVFTKDELIVNDGARYLISTGHYTNGFKTFILEPNQRLSEGEISKVLYEMLRDE